MSTRTCPPDRAAGEGRNHGSGVRCRHAGHFRPGVSAGARVPGRGLSVECLPGATAFVPALLKSGFGAERFMFEGFLPVKKGRQTRLRELAAETRTLIFYESPHRIVKTLEQLAEVLGPERPASVSRELTKLFEETVNGTLAELAA